jgi:hypothetical protein
MAKGGMLAPSMRGRMAHMLRGNDHSVSSVKKGGIASLGTAEMRMAGRRAPCMLSKAVRMTMAACSACMPLAWRWT